MIDVNDTGFVDANNNGAHDAIEGLSPTNTHTPTVVDMFNLDSDNDGCPDVIEAGFTDPNGDGKLGDNPITVDSNGKVTSGSDGYTTPIDQNSNGVEDYVDIAWDVNCLNPGLSITKSANAIDLNGDGLIQLNDQVVYTIIVTNTSEVSVTFTLSDTLSNQLSQTILTPELVWSSTSSNVNIKPPFNYVKKSSNFSYISNSSGGRIDYNRETSYWHDDGSRRSGYAGYGYYYQGPTYKFIPAIDDTFIYFAGPSTGANSAQTGLTQGYTDSTGGNANGIINHNGQNVYNHFIRFYQSASNSSSFDLYQKQFKYIEIPNLEDNTDYTLSIFTYPYGGGFSSNEIADGFFLIFHDDSNGKKWINSSSDSNLTTNWDNAQKSQRLYLDPTNYVKRFSQTFTTGTGVGTTRVGINFPHLNGAGIIFYGMQLEKGDSMSPIYTYTYTSTPDVTSATPLSINTDPRFGTLDPGVSATYIVTLTLDQSIIDNAQELYNKVDAVVSFTTPSGISVTMTSTSDDPSTPAVNDPTFTNLDNLKGIEVVKEVKQITDTNSNGQNDAGDVIKYEVTLTNTGQTNLADFEITYILQTSTGTKSIEVDPFIGKSQNYFWYSWAIDDSDWNWNESGSIYGAQPLIVIDPFSIGLTPKFPHLFRWKVFFP